MAKPSLTWRAAGDSMTEGLCLFSQSALLKQNRTLVSVCLTFGCCCRYCFSSSFANLYTSCDKEKSIWNTGSTNDRRLCKWAIIPGFWCILILPICRQKVEGDRSSQVSVPPSLGPLRALGSPPGCRPGAHLTLSLCPRLLHYPVTTQKLSDGILLLLE